MSGNLTTKLDDKVTHLVILSILSVEYEVSKFISIKLYLLYSFIITFNSF